MLSRTTNWPFHKVMGSASIKAENAGLGARCRVRSRPAVAPGPGLDRELLDGPTHSGEVLSPQRS